MHYYGTLPVAQQAFQVCWIGNHALRTQSLHVVSQFQLVDKVINHIHALSVGLLVWWQCCVLAEHSILYVEAEMPIVLMGCVITCSEPSALHKPCKCSQSML